MYGARLEQVRLRSERDLAQRLADANEERLALEEERSRIAHELHDIIGHTVNVMVGDLQELARTFTDTGLDVEVQVSGNAGGVPAGVGLAAYRIVQEALTNTMRHAGAGSAAVRIDTDGTARTSWSWKSGCP